MEKRIAILGIIVSDREASGEVNRLLHEYGGYIIGRMGIPRDGCSIITVVMEGANDTINALSGKLGRLKNVQVKSMMAK
ncbi:TM1266 family iron-only hydrogenase system putative regulator [uncultured Agathobaculum sp.]|uniref:TM1266 family iron-only hydrogenase system putative regulator n=1 Tax=uncultured Agathobaculum sp. TaxID=2048140 RepID=UPI002604BD30|nr:TM1266 family iron-only hydrogenase system putative regulator [uncultured Agathobaculum sp.]